MEEQFHRLSANSSWQTSMTWRAALTTTGISSRLRRQIRRWFFCRPTDRAFAQSDVRFQDGSCRPPPSALSPNTRNVLAIITFMHSYRYWLYITLRTYITLHFYKTLLTSVCWVSTNGCNKTRRQEMLAYCGIVASGDVKVNHRLVAGFCCRGNFMLSNRRKNGRTMGTTFLQVRKDNGIPRRTCGGVRLVGLPRSNATAFAGYAITTPKTNHRISTRFTL